MKQLLPILFLLALASCNNSAKRERMEELYAEQFKKEYSNFSSSERFKSYTKIYENLCRVTKIINESDSVLVDSTASLPDLCFISPKLAEGQINELKQEKIIADNGSEDIWKIKLFSEYPNFSEEINAVLIGSNFYRNADSARAVYKEADMHNAILLKDTTEFYKIYGHSPSTNYYTFCTQRIIMDELNNCRYVLIIKTIDNVKSLVEYSSGSTGVFKSGGLFGAIYLYDLEKDIIIKRVDVLAQNSENVSVKNGRSQAALKKDLKKNYAWAIKDSLKTNFKINGPIPDIAQ